MKVYGYLMVWALAWVIAGAGCGSDDGVGDGGEVRSDEGLHAFMQAVALDFAQVLADVAPSNTFAIKATASCPEGGTADYTANEFGQGTLGLVGCVMRGFNVTGTLNGFVFSEQQNVGGDFLTGPLTVSGAASADLFVEQLTVSATLPITDATTFWQIAATTTDGTSVCAWSGGSDCGPATF